MRKIATLILSVLCCALLLSACADAGKEPHAVATPVVTPDPSTFNYDTKTYDIASLAGKYKVQGRCPVISYKPPKADAEIQALALDYSAAAFSFNAYCEGTVTVELYHEPTAIGGNRLYLNTYVDGVKNDARKDFRLLGKKLRSITLAEDLSRGLHTFVIERQTEAERGIIYINSITINGEIYEAPAQNNLLIEFIGDSITTGYGNLYPDLTEGESDTNAASNVYQDATKTYAYLTAQNLGADYSIVAQQGIGVTSGYYPHTMLQTYEETCYQCGHHDKWNFERKADIVVINLGTNDCTMVATGKTTAEAIQKGFEAFAELVRSKYPDAKIFWAYGMMNQDAEPQIQAALDAAGGERAGFYYVKLTSNGSGGNGHPSAAAHAENAQILTDAIRKAIDA